jgi:Xaa-Pro dipeptidase
MEEIVQPLTSTKALACIKTEAKAPLFTLGKKPHGPSGLRTAIDTCRVIKDNHEIDLIRQANVISGEAHINVMKYLHRFTNEAEVEAAFMKTCIARHAKLQAYDPIAGSGANAAVLHYSENEADFGNGQTVVLDAGCEVQRYASDVTRTMPINPRNPGYWPSKETEAIYNLVESIQESCIKQLRPGKHFIELFWHAHYMVIDGLLKLGVLKGDRDDIFHTGTSRAFLPHGLGHHMGLEVHDVSPVPHPPLAVTARNLTPLQELFINWDPASASRTSTLTDPSHFALDPSSRNTLNKPEAPVLEPGMVLTVEPGIYFNAFLIDRFFLSKPEHAKFIDKKFLKQYMQVGGVRIEDDLLITKDGYENLTTAPKGKAMLKVIRDAASRDAGSR